MKKIFTLFALSLAILSCSKSDAPPDDTTPNPTGPGDVYVAGFEHNGSRMVAKYWKNGTAVELPSGNNDGYAYDIYVYNGDVYVAGEEIVSNKSIAKFWKNGVAQNITDGSTIASANKIYVRGNNVFVGYYEKVNFKDEPKIWHNGNVTNVATSGKQGILASFTVDSVMGVHAVYSEYTNYTDPWEPYYWKNGVRTPVISGLHSTVSVGEIVVSGNNIFMAGSQFPTVGLGNEIARYWKNGSPISLTDSSHRAAATDIYVNGNDVHVIGVEEMTPNVWTAKYWKNGVVTNLSDGTKDAYPYSIVTHGNDVYVAGLVNNMPAGVYARLWKNGVPINLTSGSTVAQAHAVFVW
jgi:hypothetical protein